MRKCTSFPSLVVLKHIHMVPFLLLPLLSLFLSAPPLFFKSSNSCFLNVKNGFGAQKDDWSSVFVLLSCCWLSRLTVGRIHFGVLQRVKAISAGAERSVELCANRGSHSLSASHRLEHTHKSGEALYRVWARFFSLSLSFFKFLFLSVCFSLVSSLFLSFLPSLSPCLLEKSDLF